MNKFKFLRLSIVVGLCGFFAMSGIASAEYGTCNGPVEGFSCNKNEDGYFDSKADCGPEEDQFNGDVDGIPAGVEAFFNKRGHNNVNAGMTNFNSHPGSNVTNAQTDLSIAGSGYTSGFAPSDLELAACIDQGDDPADDSKLMKGYAWNTNLGFISFFCDGAKNLTNSCGSISYGVTVQDAQAGDETERKLTGYAWSPSFGYISFSSETEAGDTNKAGPFYASYSPLNYAGEGKNYDKKFVYVKRNGSKLEMIDVRENDTQITPRMDKTDLPKFEWLPITWQGGSWDGDRWTVLVDVATLDSFRANPARDLLLGNFIQGQLADELKVAFANSESAVGINISADETKTSYLEVWDENGSLYFDMSSPLSEKYVFGVPGGASFPTSGSDNNYLKNISYDYQVYAKKGADNYWYLTGYAWTDAKVYMNFEGIRFRMPTEPMECEDDKGVCIEIRPTTDTSKTLDDVVGFDKTISNGPDASDKIEAPKADGKEGYEIWVYLRDGDDPVTQSEIIDGIYSFSIDSVDWEDTVRKNQVSKSDENDDFSNLETPWSDDNGGVKYKPVNSVPRLDATTVNNEWKVFNSDDGVYYYDQAITSYAPTYEGNTSLTIQANPTRQIFYNEEFYTEAEEADKERVKNQLLVNTINWTLSKDGADITANQDLGGRPLIFRPLYNLRELYTRETDDFIQGIVGVSEVITAEEDDRMGSVADNVKLDLELGYTEGGLSCSNPPDRKFLDPADVEYDDSITFEAGGTHDLSNLYTTPNSDYKIKLVNTSGTCSQVEGPTLFSTISYDIGSETVTYYGNKLPRTLGDEFATPSIVVQGNVYAQFADLPASDVDPILTTGDTVTNVVRNTINKNLSRYLGSAAGSTFTPPCNIDLKPGGCEQNFTIGDEDVYYVNGQNFNETTDLTGVKLNMGGADLSGKKVLIIDGTNLIIESNIYNPNPGRDDQLVIVVLSDPDKAEGRSGNVYIKNDVTNIQATVVADGAVYTRIDGLSLEASTGEVIEKDRFFEKLVELSSQLKWEGSISSRNTIGGATPGERSRYLGRANRPVDDPKVAQIYDLNYLRLFKINLQYCKDNANTSEYLCEHAAGRPIDQRCKKGLTEQDIIDMAGGIDVTGIGGEECDGINRFKEYHKTLSPDGDLVPDVTDSARWAKGLNNGASCTSGSDECQLNPVYIFYRPVDSFLFETR